MKLLLFSLLLVICVAVIYYIIQLILTFIEVRKM